MRIVNLEILGHPINIVTILLVIVLFWFAMFVVTNRGALPLALNSKDDAQ